MAIVRGNEFLCGQKDAGKYGKGDKVPVCLHFSTGKKLLFQPRLDVYSAVQAQGAFAYFLPVLKESNTPVTVNQTTGNQTDTTGNQTDTTANQTDTTGGQTDTTGGQTGGNRTLTTNTAVVTVAAQAQGSNLTIWLPYLTDNLVAKVFSAVVYVSDGKPDLVEWDNSCSLCSENCLTSPEDISEEICAEIHCVNVTDADCDPRLYITWMGKDKNGLNLESGGYRISRFRKYSLYDSYSEAKQNF